VHGFSKLFGTDYLNFTIHYLLKEPSAWQIARESLSEPTYPII
jgi:hypothetical protein